MSILISYNERAEVKNELGDLGIDADIPFDFMIYTSHGIVGIERKRFPDDFIASARDGRMAKEAAALRELCAYRIIIVEGEGRYTSDGHLKVGGRSSNWTKKGIRNLRRSIRYVEDCDIEDTYDIPDTISCIKELQIYFNDENHLSLRVRPKFESSWIIPTHEERLIHFYQGLPGISIILARKLSQYFGSPMALFTASVEDLIKVPGFGKPRSEKILNFLHGSVV